MKKRLSRLECNRETRRVLNRHGVDLTYCQYSCCGTEVKLTGWLCKLDGTDFNGAQIEAVLQDFMRVLPGMMVMGHFENWNFTTDHITFLGEKRKYAPGTEKENEEMEKLEIGSTKAS
jgi:hypothetical protein